MEELYKEYSKLVYNYLYKLCKDSTIAEELTQETFYKAMKSINKFNSKYNFSTWLYTIAKNTLIDYKRKYKEDISLNDNKLLDLMEIDTLYNDIESQLEIEKVYKIIDSFNPVIKDIFHYRLEYNLTFSEISKIINKTEGGTRLAFYRGKIKIKEAMKEYEN